jgi:hypothetical protein
VYNKPNGCSATGSWLRALITTTTTNNNNNNNDEKVTTFPTIIERTEQM